MLIKDNLIGTKYNGKTIIDYNSAHVVLLNEQGVEEYVANDVFEKDMSNNAAHDIIIAIKNTVINLKTLHRNIKGQEEWFRAHELLDMYAYSLASYEDRVVEMLMSIGLPDVAIDGSDILQPEPYEGEEALKLAAGMLRYILSLSMQLRQQVELPTSVIPVFDELESFIQQEVEYKLSSFFNEK